MKDKILADGRKVLGSAAAERKAALGLLGEADPWAAACKLTVRRDAWKPEGEYLEPGVMLFVLLLQLLGAKPHYSCEGHPFGFYIVFDSSEKIARLVESFGFFSTELSNTPRGYVLRMSMFSVRYANATPLEARSELTRIMTWAGQG